VKLSVLLMLKHMLFPHLLKQL